jgi:hypothetical protein
MSGLAIRRGIAAFACTVSVAFVVTTASAQTVAPTFAPSYSFVDLGSITGVPTNYGGLTLKFDDPNTLLIGGAANGPLGKLYSIGVTRDVNKHITGFTGTAAVFADAANNDGGVVYGPGNVLFLARWPNNELGQTKPGSTITDKVINLTTAGVPSSPGGVTIVPAGQPGAGQIKFASYSAGQWTSANLVPDGTGTYDLANITAHPTSTVVGGPEGFIYVPTGSPLFATPSILLSAYQGGRVDAYAVDANGDPIPATRQDFITGLNGAEGAFTDPLTGDFLFSTFGGSNHVIAVHGFAALPEPSTGLLIVGLAGALVARRRRNRAV